MIISSMETGTSLFCSSAPLPQRNHHRGGLPSTSSPSTSVLTFHEQAAPAVTFKSPNFASQNLPASLFLQEEGNEYKTLPHIYKEDNSSQVHVLDYLSVVSQKATLNRRQMDMGPVDEKNNPGNARHLAHELHLWHRLQNLMTSLRTEEIAASLTLQAVTIELDTIIDGERCNAVAPLAASKQSVLVAEDLKLTKGDDDDSLPSVLGATSLADSSLGRIKTVRSTRLLERRSKKRKVPKSKFLDSESFVTQKANARERLRVDKKTNEGFDQNDPLRLFLWGPETKQLLTLEEESQLITQLQDVLRLEKVKIRLQSQFGREPTLAEWAEGVGLSCRVLQTQLHSGNISRKKLINANLRLVVHVAKHYQGLGLSLQDLLQEGSMGLMKSVERFKPQAGCRFGTYAYWWIRKAIRKAIFQHCRTIRLPENVHTVLCKVMEAKKLYFQEGNFHPAEEELARRAGITVDKLEKLLFVTQIPLSMHQTVQADQKSTFQLQDMTADLAIETPELSVAKQMMRRHVRNLFSILTPEERRIIRLRFGIEDGEPKSLSGIGSVLCLSKGWVQQLERRALHKLKQCFVSQGLDAYLELLV